MNNEYILYIPNKTEYKYLLWEFLHEKNFQIHKCLYDADKITLACTLYFNPEEINGFMLGRIGEDYQEAYGLIRFEQRRKPVPKWRRKKNIQQPELINETTDK